MTEKHRPSYILRHIDPELWHQVKARADSEGHPLRWVLFQLLQLYAAKGLEALRR